ncbi:VOC family protein [Streptomyces collinus]|uniref:VOC family protein n=1 Tax=Streptomyces collinus TaxID=42684 RepID=UPI0036C43B10
MADDARFTFTKILVDDLEAEAAFYSTVLGLVEKHRVAGGEGTGAYSQSIMCCADSDEPSLLLLKLLHREAPTPGEAVLGFAVADVDEVVRATETAGGSVSSGPRSLPQHGLRIAHVKDPEGHLLELVQRL